MIRVSTRTHASFGRMISFRAATRAAARPTCTPAAACSFTLARRHLSWEAQVAQDARRRLKGTPTEVAYGRLERDLQSEAVSSTKGAEDRVKNALRELEALRVQFDAASAAAKTELKAAFNAKRKLAIKLRYELVIQVRVARRMRRWSWRCCDELMQSEIPLAQPHEYLCLRTQVLFFFCFSFSVKCS
jgi:hypothetical protein